LDGDEAVVEGLGDGFDLAEIGGGEVGGGVGREATMRAVMAGPEPADGGELFVEVLFGLGGGELELAEV